MPRLGLPAAILVGLMMSCGGKTTDGDEPVAPGGNEEPVATPPPGVGGGLAAAPEPASAAGAAGDSIDVVEDPSAPRDVPAMDPPADGEPERRALARCEALCSVPEVQCQPPFSDDWDVCLHACGRMRDLGDPSACAALFVQVSYCMEEAAVAARCETDLIYLLQDICPDLFPDYLRTCAGAQPVPPPESG